MKKQLYEFTLCCNICLACILWDMSCLYLMSGLYVLPAGVSALVCCGPGCWSDVRPRLGCMQALSVPFAWVYTIVVSDPSMSTFSLRHFLAECKVTLDGMTPSSLSRSAVASLHKSKSLHCMQNLRHVCASCKYTTLHSLHLCQLPQSILCWS